MGEQERLLRKLGEVLALIARPHPCDQGIPTEVQGYLWQLGLVCSDSSSREDIISQLWARKRILQTSLHPLWGGPGATPPAAA